jgi:hypothetical protein
LWSIVHCGLIEPAADESRHGDSGQLVVAVG